ncbi:N-acetyl-gamma-glutamyl-phosphate reductase [Paracidovorax valerianellae]|uniref:N-acetyl-gamma-glutamyl-phosphate reductase n=1 Tax=Paracidovorax valerianellae TaxID=187868 RepID=A0A1G6M7S2_9BURK|nr:N-acetyl-gamma-glutamyl-phosphate reductase [Paracidovorax valerianellae]MDA8446072.1 N-acetyl-gamma-glutamyl-phosphate reductase [Paracidovorax valerianellae]SDC51354.1 N-acetyl-gamma-glutamyl-phosphate reductase [Paracidovorax valerianellae]
MDQKLFIDGDQGTTGLDLQNRLRGSSEFRIRTLPADLRKNAAARREALNDCDIAILCLPDAAARDAVAMIENPAVRVIDASSAHRTSPGWVYGLPELDAQQAERIATATRVTNPGCYPTAAVALLRPLTDAGLLPADYPLVIQAVSGYSGQGRAGAEAHEAGTGAHSLKVYGLALEHKHVPEIEAYAGLAARPLFVPAYGSYRQGIVLTIGLHARLLPAEATGARIHECLADRYRGAAHVHVHVVPMSADAPVVELDPQVHNGSNDMSLAVSWNERTGQIVLSAVLDNLGKGAAGAAVQNLRLMVEGVRACD